MCEIWLKLVGPEMSFDLISASISAKPPSLTLNPNRYELLQTDRKKRELVPIESDRGAFHSGSKPDEDFLPKRTAPFFPLAYCKRISKFLIKRVNFYLGENGFFDLRKQTQRVNHVVPHDVWRPGD